MQQAELPWRSPRMLPVHQTSRRALLAKFNECLLTLAAAPMVTGPSTLTAAPSSTPSPVVRSDTVVVEVESDGDYINACLV